MICPSRRSRSGAAAVEFAFVVGIFVLVVFGILEYARYFFMMDVFHNAAREGARYAVVNTSSGATLSDVQTYVNGYLAGVGNQLSNFTPTGNNGTIGTSGVANIQCYRVDPTTGAPLTTLIGGVPAWQISNDWTNATYGTPIAVQITGQYRTMVPVNLLLTPSSLTISATCIMYSEGN
jgi:Flp pilus assembly protein TadG